MLRTLGLAFIVCLVPYIVSAQSNTAKTFMTQQPCNTYEEIIRTLGQYGEKPLFQGTGMTMGQNGQSFFGGMFFFTNQDSGTWTLVSVYADGMACIVSNGTDFTPYLGDSI